jgi:hypothetical protein
MHGTVVHTSHVSLYCGTDYFTVAYLPELTVTQSTRYTAKCAKYLTYS